MSASQTLLQLYQSAECCDHEMMDLMQAWWQHLEVGAGAADLTVRHYGQDWLSFLSYQSTLKQRPMGLSDLCALDHQGVRDYLGFKRSNGVSNTSLARYASSFRQFSRYVQDHQGISLTAFDTLRIRKNKQRLPKTLPKDAFGCLIQAMTDHKTNSPHPWFWDQGACLLALMYGCGLRISEALSLKPSNILGETLNITGKRGKMRQIPLLPVVSALLRHHVQTCPWVGEDGIFFGLQKKPLQPAVFNRFFKSLLAELGFSIKNTAHSLRHSFASDLLQGGADLRSIQTLLGHSNVVTTSLYLHLDPHRVRDALLSHHPRGQASA